jgi:hypothetical protein
VLPRKLLVFAISVLLAAAAGKAAEVEVDKQTGQFVIKRLAGFDTCVLDFAEIPACLEALREHVDRRPNDAFQAAKRALLHYPTWTALPFFEIAFRKRATDAQCEDEDVLRAVIEGLSRPSSDAASIELARTIAADKCWEGLQDGLVEALGTSGANFRSHACALFASKGRAVPACDSASEDTPGNPATRPPR